MLYVNVCWFGGMMINFKMLKVLIKCLKDMEVVVEVGEFEKMSKKEVLLFECEIVKLQKLIGGVKDMGGILDVIFVVDVGYYKIVVMEVNKLGVLVIVVVDMNYLLEGVDYVILGNDDLSKVVVLYVEGVVDVIFEGCVNVVNEVVQVVCGDDEYVEENV